jgi:hypothetical protein
MKNVVLMSFLILCCFPLIAQYASLPIGLSMPMDQDTLAEKEPNFVWQTNLTTIQNDPRISQQIVVVKVESDQTATEAMLVNAPIYICTGLLSNSITYPPTGTELEYGSTYAWQIDFLFNGSLVQQSDVWQFTLDEPYVPKTEYVAVRSTNDGQFIPVFDNRLNILISEPLEFELNGVIQSFNGDSYNVVLQEEIAGELVTQQTSIPTNETRYFSVDLHNLNLDNGTYQFTWLAGENRRFVLNFVIE